MVSEKKIRPFYIYAWIAALILFLAAAAAMMTWRQPKEPLWEIPASGASSADTHGYVPNPDSTLIHFTDGVEAWYVNEDLKFSFRIPDGFIAPDGKLKDSGAAVVRLSNGAGYELDITASKIGARPEDITEENLRAEFPEETLMNFSKVVLPDGTEGLAFERGTEENREVQARFIKDDYLYILAADKKSAELMELVVGTWRFGVPVAPRSAK